MNVLLIVIAGVILLGIIMVLYSRRVQNEQTVNVPTRPKQLNAGKPPIESRKVSKLSPNDAREWLDDFLLKQQGKK